MAGPGTGLEMTGVFFSCFVVAILSWCQLGGASIGFLNDRINSLNDCNPHELNYILRRSVQLSHPNGFSTALTLCSHELPSRTEDFKSTHESLWKCSSHSCSSMLQSLYSEKRCDDLFLLPMLADQLASLTGGQLYVYANRMTMLKQQCKGATKDSIQRLIDSMPRQRRGALRFLHSWKSLVNQLMPDWPYEDFPGNNTPMYRPHMATVSAVTSLVCNRFVRSRLPQNGIAVAGRRIDHDGGAAGIVPREIAANFLWDSRRNLIQRMRTTANYGRYQLLNTNKVELTMGGDIGVWVLELTQTDSIRLQAKTLCDSIWGEDKCDGQKIPAPSTASSSLVIVMGPKGLFTKDKDDRKKRDTLQPLLMMSDLDSFHDVISGWFNSFECRRDAPEQRPAILASMVFFH